MKIVVHIKLIHFVLVWIAFNLIFDLLFNNFFTFFIAIKILFSRVK